MIHKVYGSSLITMVNGEWAFIGGSVKALLCSASYTPNQDTHKYRSDLTNELSTAGGYTAGGVVLGTKSTPYTALTKTMALLCANIVYSAVTLSARYCIIYLDTGVSGTSPLISYIDFGSTQSPSSQNLQLTINAAGLITYQVA
jgi:hypothetical protein